MGITNVINHSYFDWMVSCGRMQASNQLYYSTNFSFMNWNINLLSWFVHWYNVLLPSYNIEHYQKYPLYQPLKIEQITYCWSHCGSLNGNSVQTWLYYSIHVQWTDISCACTGVLQFLQFFHVRFFHIS